MSKLAVLKRQASVGLSMTLRLTRGEDVTGLVTEIDEFHIYLDVGNKIVTIFEEILAGWEIHQNSTVSTENVNCASQKTILRTVSCSDSPVVTKSYKQGVGFYQGEVQT